MRLRRVENLRCWCISLLNDNLYRGLILCGKARNLYFVDQSIIRFFSKLYSQSIVKNATI